MTLNGKPPARQNRRMNAFTDACLVEQRGMSALLPFLESRAYRGQVIQVATIEPEPPIWRGSPETEAPLFAVRGHLSERGAHVVAGDRHQAAVRATEIGDHENRAAERNRT